MPHNVGSVGQSLSLIDIALEYYTNNTALADAKKTINKAAAIAAILRFELLLS